MNFFGLFAGSGPKRALLSRNDVPPLHRQHLAWELGRQIFLKARDERKAIIEQRGLDAAFGLPDANWADAPHNDFRNAVRKLESLDWQDVKHLRLTAQAFSGYSLREMRPAYGTVSVAAIPDNFDATWATHDPSFDIDRWRMLVDGIPHRARVKPPHMLGEIGWTVDGTIVNHDTRVYQERMTLLWRSGVTPKMERLPAPRILEIGGGYGALALALRSCLPQSAFVICDLPESLLFSGLYLSLAGNQNVELYSGGTPMPGCVTLVPNYLFHDLCAAWRCDLAINTISLSEMSAHQVSTYANGVSGLVGRNGIFFEQNVDESQNEHVDGLQNAAAIIAPAFAAHRQLDCDILLTQGIPNLWANLEQALPGDIT